MHCETEKIDELSYRFSLKLSADEIQSQVDKRLADMSRNVKMDGFRPGNVDMRLVRQKYGDSVTREVLEDALRDQFMQAVKDSGVQPVVAPQFKRQESTGDDYEFVAEVEVMPSFDLVDLSTLKVEKPQADVQDDDLDKMIDDLRRQVATYRPVVRPAADDDRVTVRFEKESDARMLGFTDDTPKQLRVSTKEGAWTVPLAGAIPGDRCALAKPGADGKPAEKSRIIVPGQTTAPDADEIGVTVTDVEECVLPEVNEAFFEKIGADDLNDLRARLRASAEQELARRLRALFKGAIIHVILDSHDIPIPPSMLKERIESMRRETVQQMGLDEAHLNKLGNLDDDLFQPQAERNVKLGLILNKIIESNAAALRVQRQEVEDRLKLIESQYEEGKQIVSHYRNDEQARAQFEQMILEDKVFSWLESVIQVTDKEKQTFDEIMSNSNAA